MATGTNNSGSKGEKSLSAKLATFSDPSRQVGTNSIQGAQDITAELVARRGLKPGASPSTPQSPVVSIDGPREDHQHSPKVNKEEGSSSLSTALKVIIGGAVLLGAAYVTAKHFRLI